MDNQVIMYAAISLGVWANVSTFLSLKRQVLNYLEDKRMEEFMAAYEKPEPVAPMVTMSKEKK